MNRRNFLGFLALPVLAACSTASELAPTLTQAAIAGVAGRNDRLTFSAITVRTTGTSYDGLVAQGYRTRLANDLKAALESQFSDRMSPLGLPLVVEVSRFGVAGIATTAFGEGSSTLAGTVRVLNAQGATHASAEVSTSGAGRTEAIAGALLGGTGSLDASYNRLLTEFAQETREAVLGEEGIGLMILRQMAN